ncbi:MAG: cyclic nucleotide-binding protein [Microvirga sp.]|jgi:CRP-like cAMP-binding protein|nr:cyclic nucleotide-binding protein [Microvirga sp.]
MVSFKSSQNRLLRNLSEEDIEYLEPRFQLVDLELRTPLETANAPIEYAHFLEDGIASVVATMPGGRSIEAGLIGRDGMSGTALVLGDDQSPNETYMQVAGSAWRVHAQDFQSAMSGLPSLRPLLLRYIQAFLTQTAHTALANGQAKIEERLARWLLMVHDRVDGDRLELTHEFLATMLGVRRPGVTEALHALEGKEVIRSLRSQVLVIDREGLEDIANGSYGVPEEQYRRLIGQLH